MRLNFVILLPPSEAKAEGGRPRTKWKPTSGTLGAVLGKHRGAVAAALAAQRGGAAALLGVGGKHLERAQAANTALVGAPTLAAAERYIGVVWDHLDLAGLTVAQRERALSRIIIPSGLMGASLGGDPVPDYRLKMGARLPGFGGTLAKWWRDAVSDAINEYARGCLVVDLLPAEHRAAYSPDPQRVSGHVIVDLLTPTGKAGGHDAKAAKGRLARHLLLSTPMIASHKDLVESTKKFSDQHFRVVTNVN
ncbi:MAG: YaaA family protein [Ilumatobacteraceae bacterium]